MTCIISTSDLGAHFCNVHHLDPHIELPVEYVDSCSLIRPTRLDLLSKITYVEEYVSGVLTRQAIFEYKEFIKAFSLGTFIEGDNSKKSFNDFRSSFENLIDSIKANGFNPLCAVPVGHDNTIIAGAHRTAIMTALKQRIPIVRLDGLFANYDANYFRDRGVAEDVIEASLSRLANYINASVFVLWPSVTRNQREKSLKIIGEEKVIYKREDYFNYEGLHTLISMTYLGHPWIGCPLNGYAGAVDKTKQIIGKLNNPVTTLLVEMSSNDALKLKQKIRHSLNCGNSGVHCTDNREESVYLLRILLNKNTRHLLINGAPFLFRNYIHSIMQYRKKIINNNLNLDNFCIVSSGVLGLYGLRLPNDIDFLSLSDRYNSILGENTESHHHVVKQRREIKELINHSVNYIMFFDIKVISPKYFIRMNKNRPEKTKKMDVGQMNRLLKNEQGELLRYRCKSKFYKNLRGIKQSRFGINSILIFMKKHPNFYPVYHWLRQNKIAIGIDKGLSFVINRIPKW